MRGGFAIERVGLAWFVGLAVAAAASAEPALNTLSPAEAAEGWILLFDGKTKFGWVAEDPANEKDWKVEDGALTCDSKAGFNHLKNKAVFQNFHLKLDFWVNKKGNSGVFFRGATGGKPFVGRENGQLKVTGYEAQIDDNDPRGLLYQTGALYDVAPAQSLIKGEEEWRSYEIIADGDHIVTKINGQTQVDAERSLFSAGHIGLQHHNPGSVIKYRNIKLKPLGLEPLFNGKDLTGWKVVDRGGRPGQKLLRQQWTVRDGLLHVEVPPIEGVRTGGQGQIETEKTFKNFLLQLDVRTNGTHLNSGVFFRSIPGEVWAGYEAQIRNQWLGERSHPIDYGTGGVYNLVRARRVVSSDKEFFKMTVCAADRYIGVWVDGEQVADFTDNRQEHRSARSGYCPHAGAIALQSHDPTTNLDFKNIEIAVLP